MNAPAPFVTFNFAAWVGMFPEFAAVGPEQAQGYFNRACLFFANSASNPAACSGNMGTLFDLLVAHIAALSQPTPGGQVGGGLVGRISSASEGSVSVSAEWKGSDSPNEAWYLQTKYGAEFWTATAQYRLGYYRANPTRVPSSVFPYRRRGIGF